MNWKTLTAFCALLTTGCDSELASGRLDLTIFGESFIEEGIPADVFEDGWSVTFSRFLVVVSDVHVARGDNTPALSVPEARVYDLTRASDGAGHLITSATVPGGRYDHTAFTIAPSDTLVAGLATAEDLDDLRAASASILVEGEAQRGDQTFTFAWAFGTQTAYQRCESAAKVDGGTHQTQLTIHADHLFYDSLVADEPAVRFDLIASADADGDGDITLAELAAVDITGLADYGVGNRTDIRDLAAFIAAKSASVGHIDGEGHCHTK